MMESEKMVHTRPAGDKSFAGFLQSRPFGICFAVITFFFLVFYVFGLADYSSLLYGDMRGFWMRALERLDGDPFRITQYWAWPPGYHIFLAEFFRLLRWMGLGGLIRLETALFINILAYAVSVYALQRIALRWFAKPIWVPVVLVLYGFGFPAWYFYSFLLSGNLAMPLFVAAVACIACRNDWKYSIAAAVLFAFASVVRPSIAPYGLAFVIFFFIRDRISWAFVARAALFSAVFFVLIFGAGAEVSRISQGKVTSLSANGGLDFFIANSRYYRIDLNYRGWHNYIVVPAVSGNPENGFFKTDVPYYNQRYYFNLGWEFIKHNPVRLLQNFEHVHDLFFARMMPSVETPGYATFLQVWDWFKLIMFVSGLLYVWMWRGLARDQLPLFGFMTGVVGLTIAVSYLFTGEPRYTYAIIFVFYLLFFKLVELFVTGWPRWKKIWMPYGISVAVICVVGLLTAFAITPRYPPTITMQAGTPGGRISSAQNVGRLYFPYNFTGEARHGDTKFKPASPSRISSRTHLDIAGSEPLALQFDICSVWPYAILIDGRLVAEDRNPFYPSTENLAVFDPGSYLEKNAFVTLPPGRHILDVIFDYSHREGGFTLCYSYRDENNWQHRNMVGKSDPRVRFSLPGEVQSP